MQRRLYLTFTLILLVGLACAAQAKPNFTGDWKLNADKSDFGPLPPPEKMNVKVAKMTFVTTEP